MGVTLPDLLATKLKQHFWISCLYSMNSVHAWGPASYHKHTQVYFPPHFLLTQLHFLLAQPASLAFGTLLLYFPIFLPLSVLL